MQVRMREQRPIPRSEELLDAAVENTFPASDPISVDHAFNAARKRENHSAGNASEMNRKVDRKPGRQPQP